MRTRRWREPPFTLASCGNAGVPLPRMAPSTAARDTRRLPSIRSGEIVRTRSPARVQAVPQLADLLGLAERQVEAAERERRACRPARPTMRRTPGSSDVSSSWIQAAVSCRSGWNAVARSGYCARRRPAAARSRVARGLRARVLRQHLRGAPEGRAVVARVRARRARLFDDAERGGIRRSGRDDALDGLAEQHLDVGVRRLRLAQPLGGAQEDARPPGAGSRRSCRSCGRRRPCPASRPRPARRRP